MAYYNYSAFGESFMSAESEEFAYRFTGQEYDEETGLHNYKARLYDSELGRFYGIDPAGQYASPYSYVGSNPVSFVDPSGEFAFSLFWFGVGKAALGGALSSAHTAYVNGGNAWQAGLQGGLTSGLGTFFGAFTPPGLVPGAIYGAAINGITGAGAAAFTGGDPARSFGVSAIGGGVSGGVVGGYRAIQEGRGFLFGRDIQTFLLPEITIFMRGGFSMAKSEWWGDTQSFLDQNPVATAVVGAMNQWSSITTNVMLTTASLMAPVPKFGLSSIGVRGGAVRSGLSNVQLVQKAATKAETAIGGTGRFAGTSKHTYANNLLSRYQNIYGDKGLRFNQYFNNNATLGPGNRGFLDVLDTRNSVIYDFKFGNATWRTGQLQKYQRNFPGHFIQIIRP